jgi:23S rRNA (cytidine1920-2'-O)/16S rRNA (cytidine1409-2'-O)-methyltransferase
MVDVLEPGREIISLIKPQFEAGRKNVPGGVVRDPEVHRAVVDEIHRFGVDELGLEWLACIQSPLKGPEGNIEFLARWRKADS